MSDRTEHEEPVKKKKKSTFTFTTFPVQPWGQVERGSLKFWMDQFYTSLTLILGVTFLPPSFS